MNNGNKGGFTLVELSIVLVIIGLLIGGILAAQSMISTAKIQNAISQIQQFDVALNAFSAKYNSLPGDSRTFGGDGDEIIESGTNDGWADSFAEEVANFWPSLQQSGFTYQNKTFTSTFGSSFDISSSTPNLPHFPLGKSTGVMVLQPAYSDVNLYYFANFDGLNDPGYIYSTQPPFTVVEALAIDSKIDDGKPASGNVNSSQAQSAGVNSGQTCDDFIAGGLSDGTTYQTSVNGAMCFLSIGILGAKLREPFVI